MTERIIVYADRAGKREHLFISSSTMTETRARPFWSPAVLVAQSSSLLPARLLF